MKNFDMNVTIRKADINDKEDIFGLVENFATSFKAEYLLFTNSIKHILEDNSSVLLVAEVDDRIIGYCLGFIHFTFYANGQVSWLEEITVHESFRGRGIGTMLMKKFEEISRSKNSRLIALATRRASDFYCSIGYGKSADYFRKLL